jgi:hypothetical protein
MNKVATLDSQDRSDIIREAASQMGLAPAIVEKDFWVCWTLQHLFGHPELGNELIFKGGTTLSKVYDVIHRFSEDIDISISRSLLGFDGERDPGNLDLSGKKRRLLLEDMSRVCSEYVCTKLKEEMELLFEKTIGAPGESWSIDIYDQDPDQQTLLFNYPSFEDRVDYIHPYVRVECGCRSDFWPIEEVVITPYLADHVPQAFENADCGVTALSVGRTFWEKATILHQEHHRAEDKPLPDRYSRHYYDLAMLAQSEYKSAAIQDLQLLARVVEHKQCFFRCGWANYDQATPGSLRLSPQPLRIAGLQRDYVQMSSMFFGDRPSFDDVLQILTDLENEINGSGISSSA